MIKSKITDKFQVTIPKEIRTRMKLTKKDTIEWAIEDDKIVVKPVKKPFLKYRGYVRVGEGNIAQDINKARKYIADKNQ